MPDFTVHPVKLYLSSIWAGDVLGQEIVGGVLVTTFRSSDKYRGGVLSCKAVAPGVASKGDGRTITRMGFEFEDLGVYSPLD